VDLEKMGQEARSARPDTLATIISSDAPLVKKYIDHLLGDVVMCEIPDELRDHRRAVTPEVLYYHEWTVRAIDPAQYRTYYIGKLARQAQIDQYRRELAEAEQQRAALTQTIRPYQQAAELLKQSQRTLSTLQRDLIESPPDPYTLRTDIESLQQALAALDLTSVEELEKRIKHLKTETERYDRERTQAQIVYSQAHAQWTSATQEERSANQQLAPRRQQYEHQLAQSIELEPRVEELLEERINRDPSEAMRDAESQSKGYNTRSVTTHTALVEAGSAYNIKYDFRPQAPDYRDDSYAKELARLAKTELPRFQSQIADAQKEAQEELREHVIHRLRERIENAKQKLNQLNDALRTLDFRGDSYRFISQPDERLHDYYDLLMKSHLLGKGTLFESTFYAENRPVFEDFFRTLTRTPETERERRAQSQLTDYRSYLTYDIEVTHADGQKSKLSKIMGQTSGGETQTPFYLAIAASFVQLYAIHERNPRSTIRIVAFDEAFSKMDQTRIGATLDLFHHFKLQIITATPLERCEYLVPKMCTNLVINANRTNVFVEPYHNYHAKLTDDE
jgi:uncharacterized protein YPO0396